MFAGPEITLDRVFLQAARERDKLSYDTTTLQADVKAHIKELMDREVDAEQKFWLRLILKPS